MSDGDTDSEGEVDRSRNKSALPLSNLQVMKHEQELLWNLRRVRSEREVDTFSVSDGDTDSEGEVDRSRNNTEHDLSDQVAETCNMSNRNNLPTCTFSGPMVFRAGLLKARLS